MGAKAQLEMIKIDNLWMPRCRNAHVADAMLNSTKLDNIVVALIGVTRRIGYQDGYQECVSHVREALQVE
ncbi:hypothetical protein HanIR_Chr15g0761721 [Helianthus annuus]|nr:hypothetical protein HanIR_Chr15g0761721 [Helianthus annuus]